MFRENRLMTQVELAEKSGVAPRTIHSVEKGNPCRRSTMRQILIGLGVPFKDRDLVFPPEQVSDNL
jgi:transcriptional regulator with XRE-family HTH domain